jgi:hypothetical protein
MLSPAVALGQAPHHHISVIRARAVLFPASLRLCDEILIFFVLTTSAQSISSVSVASFLI